MVCHMLLGHGGQITMLQLATAEYFSFFGNDGNPA